MIRIGIRFIRVVKTATKKIPMAYLSSIELDKGRGQRVGVVLKSNRAPTIMSYVWMDRDRRYLSQLLHRCRMGRIIQEYAGDNLIYQKKSLAELTMKKQSDKSLLCLIRNVLRYTILGPGQDRKSVVVLVSSY